MVGQQAKNWFGGVWKSIVGPMAGLIDKDAERWLACKKEKIDKNVQKNYNAYKANFSKNAVLWRKAPAEVGRKRTWL